MPDDLHPDTPTVTIRPRWTWAGVGLLALGAGLLGAAVIALLWPLAIAGAVAVVAGAFAAWRGNLYRDARMQHSPGEVVSDIKHERTVEVVDPDASVSDPVAREVAQEAHDKQQQALGAERGPVPIAPVGIALLVLVAGWLAVSQGVVPYDTGRSARNADLAIAIPLALAAFGLRNGYGKVTSYIVVLACGVALVLLGAFQDHSAEWVMWSQYLSAVGVFLGAALAVSRNGIATSGR